MKLVPGCYNLMALVFEFFCLMCLPFWCFTKLVVSSILIANLSSLSVQIDLIFLLCRYFFGAVLYDQIPNGNWTSKCLFKIRWNCILVFLVLLDFFLAVILKVKNSVILIFASTGLGHRHLSSSVDFPSSCGLLTTLLQYNCFVLDDRPNNSHMLEGGPEKDDDVAMTMEHLSSEATEVHSPLALNNAAALRAERTSLTP